MLAAWLLLLVGVAVWSNVANGSTVDKLSIPGTESQRAANLLSSRFPAQSGSTVRIAAEAPAGHKLADIPNIPNLETGMKPILSLPGVVQPADPSSIVTISPDGRIAFAEVRFDRPANELPKAEIEAVIRTAQQATPAVVSVAFGGDAVDAAVKSNPPPSEAIGFLVAILVLLLAFGSVVAMGLPLFTAMIGVAIGILGISLASAFVNLSSTAPTLAIMIGLAVGIDYALFIVTRHRAFVAAGLSIEESAARANATSGGAVVFAGMTVVIALAGLAVVGIPFLTAMGMCAAATVAIAVLIAITLVPAMLGFAGPNIDKLSIPGIKVTTGEEAEVTSTFSGRFARTITRRPWLFLVTAIAVMALLTLPLLSIRLGLPDDSSKPSSTTQRQAYDMLVTGFGPGFNGPLSLVVDLTDAKDKTAATQAIRTAVAADPNVAVVGQPALNPAGDTAIISAIPKTAPASKQTEALVHRLRGSVLPSAVATSGATVAVAGVTAANIDISAKLASALPVFMAFVIGLTMLLLLIVFRSILIPIKAAVAILLSIGAALGVLVAVFQWGWAASLIGVDQSQPIVSFLPLLMFGILFGLSMDYEVFILTRIKEEYSRSDDAHHSVLTGLTASARVITAAALIMISVFGAFVLGDDAIIKMFGIGLSVAVLLDATIVRMVFVPAVMTLMDRRAWWLPAWLARILPDLDIEGEKLLASLEADEEQRDRKTLEADEDREVRQPVPVR